MDNPYVVCYIVEELVKVDKVDGAASLQKNKLMYECSYINVWVFLY